MVSSFTFITTDPRRKAAREAVKVHVLRLRRNHRKRNGGSCTSGHGETNRGGQIHLWDSTVPQLSDPAPLLSGINESSPSDSAENLDNTFPETQSSSSLEFAGPSNPPHPRDSCPITLIHMLDVSSEDILIHCCRH
jgi:hypothetical protein